MRTHAEILALWPRPSAIARDAGAKVGTVRVWVRDEKIPVARYDDILAASAKRGFGVTYIELVEGGR